MKRRSKYSLHGTSQRRADAKVWEDVNGKLEQKTFIEPTSGPRPYLQNRDGITCPVTVSKLCSPGQKAKFEGG